MRRRLSSRTGQFLVFLLTPEDSSCDGYFRKTNGHPPFDTPMCGAVKIIFWIMAALVFWIILPLLCR